MMEVHDSPREFQNRACLAIAQIVTNPISSGEIVCLTTGFPKLYHLRTTNDFFLVDPQMIDLMSLNWQMMTFFSTSIKKSY